MEPLTRAIGLRRGGLLGRRAAAKLRQASAMHRRTGRALSVRLAAALVLLVFGAGATALTTAVLAHEAERRLTRQIGLNLSAHAALLASTLDRDLYDRWRNLRTTATFDAERLAGASADERLAALERLRATHSDIAWVGFADTAGVVRAATDGLLVGADVSARPWFEAGLREAHVGDVHEAVLLARHLGAEGAEPPRFVDLAAPVRDAQGAVVGVLGAHVYWSWARDVERSLQDALGTASMPAAEALILHRDGSVLLGPLGLEGRTLPRTTLAGEDGWSFEPSAEGAHLLGAATADGHLDYPGLGWTVLVRQSAETALAPVAALRRGTLAWGLALTLALAALAALAGTLLTRPLRFLADAAAALGRGEAVSRRSSPFRETQDVGEALAEAAAALDDRARARRRAEADLRESERRLAQERAFLDAVVESAPIGIAIARDAQGESLILNAEARRMTGAGGREGDSTWCLRVSAARPDDPPGALDEHPMVQALEGVETRNREIVHATDEETRRWLVNSRPLRDEEGRVVAAVTAFVDIEDQRRAEEHRALLVDEMNHRVKNILAVVQAVAGQSFKPDAPLEQVREAFLGRLNALAGAHDLLTRESWSKVSLRECVLDALEGCGVDPARRVAEGPDVMLPPRTAVTISMALHELCTNAAKYGALSTPGGAVSAIWRVEAAPEPRLRLVWRESGGPPVSPPGRRGFGSRMIEQALAADLRGSATLEFRPDGVICEIDAPLPGTDDRAA